MAPLCRDAGAADRLEWHEILVIGARNVTAPDNVQAHVASTGEEEFRKGISKVGLKKAGLASIPVWALGANPAVYVTRAS